MARPLRLEFSGALWHITARGNEQRDIFRDDLDRRRFLALLAETVIRFGWKLYAWVLMSNHYHLALESPDPNLSRGMHWLNARYAQYFNRRHKRVGHLFQGRFKGLLIEKESHLVELSRYVVLNPVRAGLVARAEDWEWSSYRATAGLEVAPAWLDYSTLLACFGPDVVRAQEEYRQFVGAFDKAAPSPWAQLTGQIYLGSREWLDRIQSAIDEKPRSAEHPRRQVMVGRPTMEDVLDAVRMTFDTADSDSCGVQGQVPRQIAAYLAFQDGLIRQSEIGAALGQRSRGAAAYLIARCRRAIEHDPELPPLLDAIRSRMRRRLPEMTPAPSEFSYPFHRRREYLPGIT